MFRLFLVNLIKSGKNLKPDENKVKQNLPPRRLRNRRIYDRFDIDHKHLSLMNDQDILLIRDLSETGFSTEVSERGFKRLVIGDIYLCRIRYLGEVYDTEAHVRWKAKGFVGFEVVKSEPTVQGFLKRLLNPLEIGRSLKQVPQHKDMSKVDNEGMQWYQSCQETDLFIWYDESEEIKSWQLDTNNQFIKWNNAGEVSTGSIELKDSLASIHDPWKKNYLMDTDFNKEIQQLAADIFMAMQHPHKEKLIRSIAD